MGTIFWEYCLTNCQWRTRQTSRPIFQTERLLSRVGRRLGKGTWNREWPDTDEVISVAGEEGLSIGWPAEGGADWWGTFFVSHDFWFEFFNNDLLFQIPDLDNGTSGSTEPVSVWWEGKSIDFITRIQSVEWLGLFRAQIPQFGGSITTTGSTERTIWGDGNSVQVASVAVVITLEFAVGEIPDLDQFIPTRWNNNWVLGQWGESNTGNPFGVTLFLDGVLANTQSVPQFDGAITGSGDNLTVVSGESDGENVLNMK